jgi:hypothetical protein
MNLMQAEFRQKLCDALKERDLEARTLGVSDYDMDAPLNGIRRLMVQACGLITVAFRRSHTTKLVIRRGADLEGMKEQTRDDVWLTSPYAQIEPAMAFQLGLPILIFREKGVLDEGVLERGVTGLYLPEFDLDNGSPAIDQPEWKAILRQWEQRVRTVYESKGQPPALY